MEQQLVLRPVAKAAFEQLKSWAQCSRPHKQRGLLNSTDTMFPSALRLHWRDEILVSFPPLGGFILEFWNLTSCSIPKFKSIASGRRQNHMSAKHWRTAVLCIYNLLLREEFAVETGARRGTRGIVWDVHLGCPAKGHAICLFSAWKTGSGGKMSNPKDTWGNPKAQCCSMEKWHGCVFRSSDGPNHCYTKKVTWTENSAPSRALLRLRAGCIFPGDLGEGTNNLTDGENIFLWLVGDGLFLSRGGLFSFN